jgi:prefoldin subunit 5
MSLTILFRFRVLLLLFVTETYEKQLRSLNNDNDKLKQHCQEMERTTSQLKRENEELQQKVNEYDRMMNIYR